MSGRNPSVINEDSAANDGTAQDGINHGRARPHRQNRTILNQNINEIVGFHFRRSRQPLLGLPFLEVPIGDSFADSSAYKPPSLMVGIHTQGSFIFIFAGPQSIHYKQ